MMSKLRLAAAVAAAALLPSIRVRPGGAAGGPPVPPAGRAGRVAAGPARAGLARPGRRRDEGAGRHAWHRHPRRQAARLPRHRRPDGHEGRGRQAQGERLLRQLRHRGEGDGRPPDHLPVQRRPRRGRGVAAPGRVRTEGRRPRPQRHARRPALPLGRQPQHLARQQRPGVRRPRRHRLQPGGAGRRRQAVLRLPQRPRVVRRLHPHLPDQAPPLGQPHLPGRRELRHHPLRRPGRLPGRPVRHPDQRRHAGQLRARLLHALAVAGQRSALRDVAAQLRRHSLLPPQAERRVRNRFAEDDRRRPGLRRRRVHAGAEQGRDAAAREAEADRRQAGRPDRPAGRHVGPRRAPRRPGPVREAAARRRPAHRRPVRRPRSSATTRPATARRRRSTPA